MQPISASLPEARLFSDTGQTFIYLNRPISLMPCLLPGAFPFRAWPSSGPGRLWLFPRRSHPGSDRRRRPVRLGRRRIREAGSWSQCLRLRHHVNALENPSLCDRGRSETTRAVRSRCLWCALFAGTGRPGQSVLLGKGKFSSCF